ncbi:MAG: 30S ribosomal protein S1 [Deltaproteobacteria bacterium]|nr:30S ribosomal protein S1 [Deltaproteobacteria bacterium]
MVTMEDNPETQTADVEMDFQQLYEQSLTKLKEGELVKGTVVQITKDSVVVDIGCKSEGVISLDEFLDKNGQPTVAPGEEISILLEKWEDERGYVRLSKRKAEQLKVWDEIAKAVEDESTIEGIVSQCIKGGFYVDFQGIMAFLPNSQVDILPVLSTEKLIGQKFDFSVIKFSKAKNNVIVSRRVLLEKERVGLREETLKNIKEGTLVQGIVKNITDYGAFVDLGGIDGLLHLTDMTWGKVTHPTQVVNLGDTITVKVLKFDEENSKISLGLKQTKDDPWGNVSENYPVNSKAKGKVMNLTDYGAFVELEDGLEGLIHISEMSWTKLRHPSQKLKVGSEVEVMVLDVDGDSKRISLGLKQVEPNPWDDLDTKYPKGTKVSGIVKNITDFGIFIGVDEGIDGLIHISDLSWKKVKHPTEIYKKGDKIEAVVLNIDNKTQRFSLSTKLLEKNPWENVEERYQPGMICSGKVTGVADFGAFIELEVGLEGLIHISEIQRDKDQGTDISVGDTVEVEILNVDSQEKKIGLSIRKPDEDSTTEAKATDTEEVTGSEVGETEEAKTEGSEEESKD